MSIAKTQTDSLARPKVPLLDLHAQHIALRDELQSAVWRTMESQHFILGAEVKALEEEIARYSQSAYGIGCASGSDALLLALMALNIGAGDEVITTPYSFFATAGSIARLGARPVFVDINPQTYNMDASKVEAAITKRTRAIMPVHLFGQCADMDALAEAIAGRDIPCVEDAAQAIGAEDKGRRAGSIGTIGCFSFYPSKNLGGAGDGGMIVTGDAGFAERLRVLRVHGAAKKYYHNLLGVNSRLDAMQAAILRVKLPHLDAWSQARQRNAERYNRLFDEAGLANEVTLPFVRDNVRHIYNQYVVRLRAGRDELIKHLKDNDIGSEIYYPLPLHLQECFKDLGYTEGDFPEAERAARETLALPIYPELTVDQQQHVVETIRRFYQ